MKLNNLRTDDSAVSPVIGVILMVAITVILAAVIGTFVLNLGNQVQSTAPQASFSFDQISDSEVGVEHDGGDTILKSNLKVTVNGNDVGSSDVPWNEDNDDEVTAGSSVTVTNNGDSGNLDTDDTIRVIWTSDSGENSQVLAEYTVA